MNIFKKEMVFNANNLYNLKYKLIITIFNVYIIC